MVKRILKYLYIAAVYLVLYVPLLVTIVFSFNNSVSADAWHGFTLKWYESLLADKSLINSAFRSLFLAARPRLRQRLSARLSQSLCTGIALSDRKSFTDRCPLLCCRQKSFRGFLWL